MEQYCVTVAGMYKKKIYFVNRADRAQAPIETEQARKVQHEE